MAKIRLQYHSCLQEKEKFDREVNRLQQNLAELQAVLNDEAQKVQKLQMELDAKESENEHLMHKLSLQGAETASVSSNNDLDLDDSLHGKAMLHNLHNALFCSWRSHHVH